MLQYFIYIGVVVYGNGVQKRIGVNINVMLVVQNVYFVECAQMELIVIINVDFGVRKGIDIMKKLKDGMRGLMLLIQMKKDIQDSLQFVAKNELQYPICTAYCDFDYNCRQLTFLLFVVCLHDDFCNFRLNI